MTCEHWQTLGRRDGGQCAKGLHGGRVSFGVCRICPDNTAKGQWPTINGAPLDPAALALLAKQYGGCKGCGDAPPEGL